MEFVLGQKVLVRDSRIEIWEPALFGYYTPEKEHGDTYPYTVFGGQRWRDCIPLEGNEALIGTKTDSPASALPPLPPVTEYRYLEHIDVLHEGVWKSAHYIKRSDECDDEYPHYAVVDGSRNADWFSEEAVRYHAVR